MTVAHITMPLTATMHDAAVREVIDRRATTKALPFVAVVFANAVGDELTVYLGPEQTDELAGKLMRLLAKPAGRG